MRKPSSRQKGVDSAARLPATEAMRENRTTYLMCGCAPGSTDRDYTLARAPVLNRRKPSVKDR